MNWIRILYSLQFLVFIVLPCLYKSKRPSMIAFYDSMIWRKSARIFYTLTFFLFLVVLHFYHLTIFKNHYAVIPSTIVCYALLSHKVFEKTMRFLQEPWIYFCALMITTACLFIPHLFMLGVSFGVIMIATVFYPAEWWNKKKEDLHWIDEVYFEKKILNQVYFSWKDRDEKTKGKADVNVRLKEDDGMVELVEAEEVENPELPFINTDIEDLKEEEYIEYKTDVQDLAKILTTPLQTIEFRKRGIKSKTIGDENL